MRIRSCLSQKVSAKCQCFTALLCKVIVGDHANSPRVWRSLGLLPHHGSSAADVDRQKLMEEVPGVESCVNGVFEFLIHGPTPEHDSLYVLATKNERLCSTPYARKAIEDYHAVQFDEDEIVELQRSFETLLHQTPFKRAVFAVYTMRQHH